MPFINRPDTDKLQDILQRARNGDAEAADYHDALAVLTNIKGALASPGLREKANDCYATDDIEIDDEPATSQADGGTWVAAWVWIEQDTGDEDETNNDNEDA